MHSPTHSCGKAGSPGPMRLIPLTLGERHAYTSGLPFLRRGCGVYFQELVSHYEADLSAAQPPSQAGPRVYGADGDQEWSSRPCPAS